MMHRWSVLAVFAWAVNISPVHCDGGCPAEFDMHYHKGIGDRGDFHKCTQHKDEILKFIFIGDTGGKTGKDGDDEQKHWTTEQQLRLAEQFKTEKDISFVLSNGDNFYPHGLKAALTDEGDLEIDQKFADQQFKNTFLKVYQPTASRDPTTHRDPPWYVVAGNHDVKSKGSRELERNYTERGDNFNEEEKEGGIMNNWCYPKNTYTFCYTIGAAETETRIRFIMIDTNDLCGQLEYDGPDEELQNEFEPWDSAKRSEVVKFVERWTKIGHENGEIVFVVGHYMPFSAGRHGFGPTANPPEWKKQNEENKEQYEKYKSVVQSCVRTHLWEHMKNTTLAYLTGHDHNVQHIETVRNVGNVDGTTALTGSFHTILSGTGSRFRWDCNLVPLQKGSGLKFCYGNKTLNLVDAADAGKENGNKLAKDWTGYIKNAKDISNGLGAYVRGTFNATDTTTKFEYIDGLGETLYTVKIDKNGKRLSQPSSYIPPNADQKPYGLIEENTAQEATTETTTRGQPTTRPYEPMIDRDQPTTTPYYDPRPTTIKPKSCWFLKTWITGFCKIISKKKCRNFVSCGKSDSGNGPTGGNECEGWKICKEKFKLKNCKKLLRCISGVSVMDRYALISVLFVLLKSLF